MRNPLSDKVVEMKPSGIRKFFDLVQEMPNAISLGVGEPDFDTPWHIREEGIYSLEKGRTFYTSNAGLLELRKAIAHYMYRKYDLEYDPVHEIVVTVGGSEGIDLALRAMINPGDEVILPEPAFVSYLPCIKLADGVPVTINLKEENQFKLQPEELLAAITDKTKILILSYPNNPTGATAPDAFYEELIRFAKANDIIVLHDTAYSNLVFDGEEGRSFLYYEGAKDIGIEFNSFSKTYGMAGARIGICVGNKEIVGMLRKLKSNIDYGMFLPIQKAAITALTQDQSVVEETREQYQKRRDMLVEGFHKAGWEVASPKGTMFMWAAIPKTYANSEQFAIALLQKTGVLVTPGSAFGTYGEGFVRIALVQSEEVIEKALQAVQKSGFFIS